MGGEIDASSVELGVWLAMCWGGRVCTHQHQVFEALVVLSYCVLILDLPSSDQQACRLTRFFWQFALLI